MKPRLRNPTTFTVSLLLAGLAWAACVAPLALVLAVVATTWLGRLFALTSLLAAVLPCEIAVMLDRRSKAWKTTAGATALGFLVGGALLAWCAPAGTSAGGSRVHMLYADGRSHFQRFALGNLLPEVDQLRLAFTILPAADPLFNQRQSAELKGWTDPIYRELDSDPEFRALGSAMPQAYDDFLGWGFDHGHAFVFVPTGMDRSQAHAALVFLHGSGGNFKAYLWLLSRVAERLQIIVIAPTYGLGNWRDWETERVVTQAISATSKVAAIDRENLQIMGISNGGIGVGQVARTPGIRFRSVILVSPVFDIGFSQSAHALPQEWTCKSALVLTGHNDDRVPLSYVKERVAVLEHMGVGVTLETFEDADHFLFFSHRERMASSLEKWLAAHAAAAN